MCVTACSSSPPPLAGSPRPRTQNLLFCGHIMPQAPSRSSHPGIHDKAFAVSDVLFVRAPGTRRSADTSWRVPRSQ
ncbi:hypothetical protein L226DRAFT_243613 [Lentinus tigrinus ALCF2SS1-7]|uniref:uncharacterized protein n=1 Tax=Lentinus tigrinus ALCF2SS1-7 TaxID=1328758 RepID=UPI0011661E5E|nr:hypothetical protein L226DRAFT_243613 [Lentinus tigrinus ALCF2SS1-7]